MLDSLLYKYRNVLENKHKGAVQVAQKTKYWSIVTNEFNAASLNITVSYLISDVISEISDVWYYIIVIAYYC